MTTSPAANLRTIALRWTDLETALDTQGHAEWPR